MLISLEMKKAFNSQNCYMVIRGLLHWILCVLFSVDVSKETLVRLRKVNICPIWV